MSVKTCKTFGHSWKLRDVIDNFDEISVSLRCTKCNAEVEVDADVRGYDGRFIEYHLEEE
jgi:hypothetical protein